MAVLQAGDLADLVATTLNELGELKFTDLMSDYQDTIALKRVMKKNKMTFDAGPAVSFNVITDHNNSARFVGLGEVDVVDIPNVMTTGTVPWRHITWNWAIERREVAMNRSPRKIVDLAKTRRIAAFGSAILAFERALWRVPATTDLVSPYGIPYWIVKSATANTTNFGFNGLVPSGYTTVGGLNPTTYPSWANYAGPYVTVSYEDFVRKARHMFTYTDFKPLVDDIPTYNTGNDQQLYANYALISALEELLGAQNDDLGNDLAAMDGKVMLRRSPVNFVRELDADTTAPLYLINWGEMKTMGLRGEWMNETTEAVYPGQHTISATFTDCTWNLFCRNRRRNGVISVGTTLPA